MPRRHSYLVSGWFRQLARLLPIVLVALLAGELASRLDDWIFEDTPILASPDREVDLVQQETWGFRGRSGGSFRRWKLNSFGFLGPEFAAEPQRPRLMVMGASEAFGLYERQNNDFPSQLGRLLHGRGFADEVVNAAVAGMSLPTLTVFWENWASRFKPQVVLIYPSTHFYLDDEAPAPPRPTESIRHRHAPLFKSRLLDRAISQVRTISLLRTFRAQWIVSKALSGRSADYVFKTPPAERIAQFSSDLEALAISIERKGAKPVLITHAYRFPLELTPTDRSELEYFRIFMPRSPPEVMPAFTADANAALKALGTKRGWPVIDAAALLTGQRTLFADPVHFTDEGSRRMAEIIANAITAIAPSQPRRVHD